MRYLVGFGCLLAALLVPPLSVSAQAGEDGTEPNLREPAPSSEPAAEEPALQLELDALGVDVTPGPRWTPDEYTLEEMEHSARRAKVGLGVSGGVLVVGVVMAAFAFSSGDVLCALDCEPIPGWVAPVGATGGVLMFGGLVGVIVSGVSLGRRQRDLLKLQEETHPKPGLKQPEPAQDRYDPLGIGY